MELASGRRGKPALDARVKLLGIVAAGCLLVGKIPAWAEWIAFFTALLTLFNYGYYKSALNFSTVFFLMWFFPYVLQDAGVNPGVLFLLLLIQVTRKFIPCLMFGKMFLATTSISEVMAVTQNMKIHYRYAIPFAVVIRFFPTFLEEWNSVRMAMRMRGIRFNPEYILVPLLNSALRISDELSAAALSRGLGSVEKRSQVCRVKLRATDWIFMILMIAFIILVTLLKG